MKTEPTQWLWFLLSAKAAAVLFTQPRVSMKYMTDTQWPERELAKAVCGRSIMHKPLMADPNTTTIQTLKYFSQCFSNYDTPHMLGGLLRCWETTHMYCESLIFLLPVVCRDVEYAVHRRNSYGNGHAQDFVYQADGRAWRSTCMELVVFITQKHRETEWE